MIRRSIAMIGMLILTVFAAVALPAAAQSEGEARLGGGSDIPTATTVRLPQGGSIPAIHNISADNPGAEPIEVEFRADTAIGIVVDAEWDTMIIPAEGSVINHFSVAVAPSVAPGEYPVVIQLVRSDIESEPGRVTNLPAIQSTFVVEVVGDAAAVTVRTVSTHSGSPVTATITLSTRMDGGDWFEIDRTEGEVLETRVAPGDHRAAVLLGEREVAAEEFTIAADETIDVAIEVETVSFVVAAARPVTESGRLVVVELVASVNNETGPIAGPNMVQAVVSHKGVEVDTVTLAELSEVGGGITEASATYRPDDGWQEGTYRFALTLVTPAFTLTSPDQPVLEVPAMGFDLLTFLTTIEAREAIALAAVGVLVLVVLERLFRHLVGRRRRPESGPPRRQRRAAHAATRPSRRRDSDPSASDPEPNWLEGRIGPVTARRAQWDDDAVGAEVPHSAISPTALPDVPSDHPTDPAPPLGMGVPATDLPTRASESTLPTAGEVTSSAATDRSGDTAQMVEALRVVQRLQDEGTLAPGWSVTDATLVYWAMSSHGVHEALGAVGMTEKEYVTSMRRLFTHGILGRKSLERDSSPR